VINTVALFLVLHRVILPKNGEMPETLPPPAYAGGFSKEC